MIKIAPSILSADFSKLGEEAKSVETADYLHFDVMDGVFVPNISIGLPVLESVRKATDMTLDVHLMIASPSKYAARFAAAGADIVVFHIEAEPEDEARRAIAAICGAGKRAGLAIKPGTPAETLLPYLETLSIVLVMTVEPGFGGQTFMPETLPKIALLRETIEKRSLHCEIEVDGGINPETAALCVKAGADVLVAGNDVFRSDDRAARISRLRSATAG
ncbi:MAG: ribulose-phosphate 3-epimerase [Oscillospiraceae bacterium]|nr:ribulose-phosphate 3-epimerase [Oscillospiraceae bacterium]